jgi:rubrerythrin
MRTGGRAGGESFKESVDMSQKASDSQPKIYTHLSDYFGQEKVPPCPLCGSKMTEIANDWNKGEATFTCPSCDGTTIVCYISPVTPEDTVHFAMYESPLMQ